jgi:hypothetical protein
MGFFWVRDTVIIGVAQQLMHYACANVLACLRIGGCNRRCNRRRRQMIQHKFVYLWHVHIETSDAYFYIRKTSFHGELPQFVGSWSLPSRIEASRDLTDATNGMARVSWKQRLTHFTEELKFLSESDKDWVLGRAIQERLKWTQAKVIE